MRIRGAGLAWILIGIGAALRTARWIDARSLWVDEARVALNLLDRSYAGLLEPLDFDQGAPVGFLLAAKLVSSAFGSNELSLRALPLAAGLAALPCFRAVSRRLLPQSAALLALALFALSEPLVHYSAELKPYAADVLAALALTWGALRVRDAGRGWVPLAFGGAVALAFSNAAVFVCAGLASVLALERWRRGGWRAALPAAALGALWALVFAALWLAFLRDAETRAYMAAYWKPGFMPFPPTSLTELAWYPRMFFAYFADPAGFRLPGLAMVATLLGAAALLRRDAAALGLLLAPVAFLCVASALGLYPIATAPPAEFPWNGRLILFTTPACTLLVAAGIGGLARAEPRALRAIAALTAALLLLAGAATSLARLVDPPRVQEMRDVAAFVAQRLEPGDRLLAHDQAIPLFRFYARRAGLPADLAVEPVKGGSPRPALARQVDALPAGARVWLVYAHHRSWGSEAEERFLSERLARRGTILQWVERPGASARLVALGPPSPRGR